MAYGFRPIFRGNLYVMCSFCDYVMVKDKFLGFRDCSKPNTVFWDGKNPEQNGKRGYAQISAHPCESAVSTLDDHNFLVRTLIRAFLDSTESSLNIEFNKIKFSAKM